MEKLDLTGKASILQKIVQDKLAWVAQKKLDFPLSQFEKTLQKSDRSFYQALAKGDHKTPAYILECKKASPSKGLIREDFDPKAIADVYKNYASAISVLTDEEYFQGNFEYIAQVREKASQPILCKDFFVSPYQVYLARYYQADAILLMLSVLDDEHYLELSVLAEKLGMGILTEVSNSSELERALKLNAKAIGINNRNLHDLSVDLNRTIELAAKIPVDRIIISESGIYNHQQIQQLKPFVQGFLIGSSLMAEKDLNNAVRAVIFGENKVCGLTREQDVENAYQAGALYAGLIFAEGSPRQLSLRQAQQLVTQAPLRFVGVFQNQSIDFIVKIASQLDLFAVQLHGNENADFIQQLRTQLDEKTQIWKAVSIDVEQTARQIGGDFPQSFLIKRYIFDSKINNQQGGTGVPFNWKLIPTELKHKVLLAGGISPNNIQQALEQKCLGVDLNSGIERSAGVKDSTKLEQVFTQILEY